MDHYTQCPLNEDYHYEHELDCDAVLYPGEHCSCGLPDFECVCDELDHYHYLDAADRQFDYEREN